MLPPDPNLATFLAWLKRARVFISGDTAPLHYAAAVGVPTIGLFGPTLAIQWAPRGKEHQAIQAPKCGCHGNTGVCLGPQHCLAAISPREVFQRLQKLGATDKLPP